MRKYELKINDQTFKIEVNEFSAQEAKLTINDKPFTVEVSGIEHSSMKSQVAKKPVPTSAPSSGGTPVPFKPTEGGGGGITAPIPGKIMEIFVKEGDTIKVGQPVLKMEAMKMENVINATTAGTVGKILVNEGDAVGQGQEMIVLG